MTKNWICVGIAIAALLATGHAHADDRTFMGIKIGDAVPPECPTEQMQFGGPIYKNSGATYPCWVALGGSPNGRGLPGNGKATVQIWVDPDSRPDGTSLPYADIYDGKVESLSVTTGGFSKQESLLADLTKKYGKPSELKRDPVQTGAGAKFDQIHAVWTRPDLRVEFFGMLSTIAEGHIAVRTDAAQARFQEEYGREKSF